MSKEDTYKISAKGMICGCLINNSIPNAMEITEEIWNKLYELGCKEIGETGLPALVIEKSGGGKFLPVVRHKGDDEDDWENEGGK